MMKISSPRGTIGKIPMIFQPYVVFDKESFENPKNDRVQTSYIFLEFAIHQILGVETPFRALLGGGGKRPPFFFITAHPLDSRANVIS